MCHYQQLYFDEAVGYVIRCSQCRNMQLGFGNLMLTFEETAFTDFQQLLNRIAWECRHFDLDDMKRIQVPMPYTGVSMLLSKKELGRLLYMLDAADTELQAISLVDLFRE
jgi:hypothetical protein